MEIFSQILYVYFSASKALGLRTPIVVTLENDETHEITDDNDLMANSGKVLIIRENTTETTFNGQYFTQKYRISSHGYVNTFLSILCIDTLQNQFTMTLTRQACIIQDNPGQGTKMVFMVCMEHALILNMPCNRITDFLWIKKYMTDLVLMLHIVPRSELTGA